MTNTIKYILLSVLGLGVLVFSWWTLGPLFYDNVVNEELPTVVEEKKMEVKKMDDKMMKEDKMMMEKSEIKADADVMKKEVVVAQPDNALVKVKTGSFSGYDALHSGSGTVSLYKQGDKNFIRFESNFTVTNGPDLYVSLGKNGKYTDVGVLSLLKGNKGSQNYEIPSNINPADFDSVYVWCKAFSVPFAKADLR